jgi:hypothetical protein
MPKAKPKNKQTKGKQNVFTKIANKFYSMGKASQVLVLTLMIGIIGGGGFAVYNTYAAVPYLNSTQCYLLGRVYVGGSGNPCASRCISGAGRLVTASPYNYCSGAVSKISSRACSSNNRVWINNGCARNWTQPQNELNAKQCKIYPSVYKTKSTTDKCYPVSDWNGDRQINIFDLSIGDSRGYFN